jgi:hypothetical protein
LVFWSMKHLYFINSWYWRRRYVCSGSWKFEAKRPKITTSSTTFKQGLHNDQSRNRKIT